MATQEVARVKLQATMVTDVGVVRDHNEDCAHVDGASTFFIVADGMGGHAAGEVASAMAVDTVRKTLEAARPKVDAFTARPSEQGRRDLVQLLQNAVRHGFPDDGYDGDGTVRVVLENDGRQLCVQVADDGVGLADQDLQALAGRAPEASTSLGLTIVRTLVSEMGGAMSVTSDSGMTFELRIPLAVGREATSP